jgi:hypothetical protein
MTTSIRKELSRDLFGNAGWPLFSQRTELDCANASLAAYTLTWKSPDSCLDELLRFSSMGIEHKVTRVIEALGYVPQVFLVHIPLQPKSATVIHRRLWKMLWRTPIPDGVTRGAESRFDCNARVRFATLGTVLTGALPWVLSAAREFELAIPILFRSPLPLDETTVATLARAGLPPDGCASTFDWACFVRHVSFLGGITVRQTVNLAKSEVSVDFFCSGDEMISLASVVEVDDELTRDHDRRDE